MPPRTSPRLIPPASPARPRLAISGRLADLREILARHGDVPLRVLVRDMASAHTLDTLPD